MSERRGANRSGTGLRRKKGITSIENRSAIRAAPRALDDGAGHRRRFDFDISRSPPEIPCTEMTLAMG